MAVCCTFFHDFLSRNQQHPEFEVWSSVGKVTSLSSAHFTSSRTWTPCQVIYLVVLSGKRMVSDKKKKKMGCLFFKTVMMWKIFILTLTINNGQRMMPHKEYETNLWVLLDVKHLLSSHLFPHHWTAVDLIMEIYGVHSVKYFVSGEIHIQWAFNALWKMVSCAAIHKLHYNKTSCPEGKVQHWSTCGLYFIYCCCLVARACSFEVEVAEVVPQLVLYVLFRGHG